MIATRVAKDVACELGSITDENIPFVHGKLEHLTTFLQGR